MPREYKKVSGRAIAIRREIIAASMENLHRATKQSSAGRTLTLAIAAPKLRFAGCAQLRFGARYGSEEVSMSDTVSLEDRTAIANIISKLEAAWNAGDGVAFGAPMAADADCVTIRAEHYRGRDAIAAGHSAIFRTLYAGSTIHYTLQSVRLLRTDVALVHVKTVLDAPTGPLAGRHSATFSAVLTREAEGWQVAAFHNTLAPPGDGTPANLTIGAGDLRGISAKRHQSF
jgi:uncharacterized protein (TIGR02246 family)